MCGDGGERWVEGAALDGYHAETKTFFQYHCCYWHGYPKCFPNNRKRYIFGKDRSLEIVFKITLRRTRDHRKAGYNVIEAWQCETEKKKTKPFPKSTQEPTSTRFCTISNLSWTAADGHAHIRERTLAHLGEHRGHSRARAHAHLRKGPRGINPQVHGGVGEVGRKHPEKGGERVHAQR